MIVPFRKNPLLPALLGMAGRPATKRRDYNVPEDEPSTAETKLFRKAKAKRKITRASRRKNR